MKLSKGQGVSFFAALILFGIFNVIVFLAPFAHTVAFWAGYFFALFALVTMAMVLVLYFGKPVPEDKFLSLPSVKVAWTYFILQSALSVWEMSAFPLAYQIALIINLIVGAVFAIIIVSLYAASGKIDASEKYTAEKVIFIKQLKYKLDSIETDNVDLEKKIKELAEDVRFSDQMSHSKLAEIEGELDSAINELVDNASNTEVAFTLCTKVAKLLKSRNEQCKMYKGVKDPEAAKAKKSSNGNGLGVTYVGVCVMLAMLLIALTVYFYIAPQSMYNEAVALMEEGKYEEAADAFESLGNYRDSKEQIDHIFNMQETEGKIYFGMYNGEAIAWTILHTDNDKMLMIAESPVATLSFHNTLQKVTWETSDIRNWLNNDFLKDFSTEQKERILESAADDISDKVFLLSQEEYEQYSNVINKSDSNWWTRTKTNAGVMFYNAEKGELNIYGEGVVHSMGVRPCVWVTLK